MEILKSEEDLDQVTIKLSFQEIRRIREALTLVKEHKLSDFDDTKYIKLIDSMTDDLFKALQTLTKVR